VLTAKNAVAETGLEQEKPRPHHRNLRMAWSLIPTKKTIVLFERHCHATEKSEAIECARVVPVNKAVDPKRIIGKNGGVADPPPKKRNLRTRRIVHLCMQDNQIGPKNCGVSPS
jgi:hypothetical protein